jgi:hypothetical protein
MRSFAAVVVLAAATSAVVLAGCDDPKPKPRRQAPSQQERTDGSRAGATRGDDTALPAPDLPEPTHRYGDAGIERVPEPQAELYPQQDRWADAGVGDGIPADLETVAEVSVGSDVQKALDGAEAPGVVLLSAGEYEISSPIRIPSGLVLRGSGEDTVIRSDADSGVVVVVQDASRAGLEKLTLVYAPADAAPPADPLTYANTEGFTPTDRAAVELVDSADCWVSDVAVRDALSHPVAVRGSRGCTLRGVTVDGVRNRGARSGEIILADSRRLLLNGWRVRGVRLMRLSGPLQWTVIRGSLLSCCVYFDDADRIEGLLTEDVHFLFRPGYPFAPYTKDQFPAGPNNMLINVTAYHQGTDAVGGLLPEKGRAYEIHKYADRVVYNPASDISEKTPFITPYQKLTARRSLNWKPPVKLSATWEQAPEGTGPIHLQSGKLVDDWMWTTAVEDDVLDANVAGLVESPLVPGQERTIAKAEVSVARYRAPERSWERSNPANAQQMIGRFGVTAKPPGGSEVSVLDRVKGDWKSGLVLQRVIDVPGEPTLSMRLQNQGTRVRVFLGTRELEKGTPYRLAPGSYPLTVLVKLYRPIDLIKDAKIQLRFELMPSDGKIKKMQPVRVPENGFLYPYVGLDPLADQRDALAAWRRFRKKTLRSVPLVDGAAKARALGGKHPGTHVAWLLEAVADVLEGAPCDESEDLSRAQWGELADYYQRQGLPERTWRINRTMKPETFRQTYPDVEVTR